MAITNASTLAEYASGISTQGATLTVDANNKRVGIGTTNPQAMLQVGTGVTVFGNAGIASFTSLKLSGDTDSTSVSTGALTVTGGVGIGLSLTVGGDVSVGGTITYEDVTNVDSLGIVTARSGVRIVGGGVTCVGVATFFSAIDANGALDVDGQTDLDVLNVSDTATFASDVSIADKIIHTGDTNTALRFPSADTITAETGGSEALRVDSSGRLLVGTTSDVAPDSFGSLLQVDSSGAGGSIALGRHTASASGPVLLFHKSRSGGAAGSTVVQDGDNLGTIRFFGADGTDRNSYGAQISANVDGTPGSNDMPGNLLFATTADGAATATERLRITSAGAWGIAGTNYGSDGQVLTSGGSGAAVAWESVSAGIKNVDFWRLSASATGNQLPITSNFETVDTYGWSTSGRIGSGMTHSSGVFTFPNTGIWWVIFNGYFACSSSTHQNNIYIDWSADNASSWNQSVYSNQGVYKYSTHTSYGNACAQAFFDVTDTSNQKVRFQYVAGTGSEELKGSSTVTYTSWQFICLGDT